jgi:hypothetical protein
MARRNVVRGIPAAVWFSQQSFHTFIRQPSTGRLLDAQLADNARVDAEIAAREAVPVEPTKEGV